MSYSFFGPGVSLPRGFASEADFDAFVRSLRPGVRVRLSLYADAGAEFGSEPYFAESDAPDAEPEAERAAADALDGAEAEVVSVEVEAEPGVPAYVSVRVLPRADGAERTAETEDGTLVPVATDLPALSVLLLSPSAAETPAEGRSLRDLYADPDAPDGLAETPAEGPRGASGVAEAAEAAVASLRAREAAPRPPETPSAGDLAADLSALLSGTDLPLSRVRALRAAGLVSLSPDGEAAATPAGLRLVPESVAYLRAAEAAASSGRVGYAAARIAEFGGFGRETPEPAEAVSRLRALAYALALDPEVEGVLRGLVGAERAEFARNHEE